MADVQLAADALPAPLRPAGRPGRLRQPGGEPAPGPGHRGHHRRGPPTLAGGEPAQRLHQGPRHRRRACPPFRQLISEGINVNVTLLFGLPRYGRWPRPISPAWRTAPGHRGSRCRRVASVASFFLSRIDVLLDPELDRLAKAGGPLAADRQGLSRARWPSPAPRSLTPCTSEIFGSDRFKNLAARGARTQRLLWASTSTKNPDYPDVKYVEPLIGPDTVNTLPPETLEAYRDHGNPASRLGEGVDRGHRGPAAPAGTAHRPRPGDPAAGGRGHRKIQQAL